MPFLGALSPRLAALMPVALWAWLDDLLSTAFFLAPSRAALQTNLYANFLTSSSKRMNFALFTRVSSSSMWR